MNSGHRYRANIIFNQSLFASMFSETSLILFLSDLVLTKWYLGLETTFTWKENEQSMPHPILQAEVF